MCELCQSALKNEQEWIDVALATATILERVSLALPDGPEREEGLAKMDALGIVHGLRGKGGLDEAPGAYKDIDTVMANQTDLVKVTTRLRPLGSIKG